MSTDHYYQLESAIETLKNLIKKYKNVENTEIEIRLGIIEDSKFNSGLNSEQFYNKIKEQLNTYKQWNKVEEIESEEQINGNIKKIENNYICKKKLETVDFNFKGTPYDFRISVCTETPIKVSKFNPNLIRKKNRTSYYYKECKFDLTKVEIEDNDEIIENEEFEIELLNLNSNTSDLYRAHSALLKIYDVINICEEIKSSAKLIKII